MQFLLVLSAMLASLTGFMSGDRAAEPRHVEQAVAASAVADIVPAAIRTAEIAAPLALPAASIPAAAQAFYPTALAALTGLAPVDERRLE